MATMNISVTDKMKAWVEAKVAAGDYATASDCLRDLLRRQIDEEEKLAGLRVEVQKGLDSGIVDRPWRELVDEVIAHGLGRAKSRAAVG